MVEMSSLDVLQAENMAYLAEADLACHIAAADAL
jgi:hypothetical protein